MSHSVAFFAVLAVLASMARAAKKRPHVLFVVGDDVGYGDIGSLNDGKTITPTLDGLLEVGMEHACWPHAPIAIRWCPSVSWTMLDRVE